MKILFQERDLVSISLKKLGKSVAVEEDDNLVFERITMIKNSLRCNLDLRINGEFETLAFALKVGQNVVNVQVRAFSGGIKVYYTNGYDWFWCGTKLGKVSYREAIDLYRNGLKKNGN